MNPVIDAIKTRRSVRKFKPDAVPENLLNEILECGRHAPSGGNNQFCHFLVIQDDKVLQRVQVAARETFANMQVDEETYKSLKFSIEASKNGNYMFAFGAPVLIVVANQKNYGNAMADSACALENMMLAAHSLDLGTCWVNQLRWLRDDESIAALMQKLGMKEDETVYGAIALGYADTDVQPPAARKGNVVTFVK